MQPTAGEALPPHDPRYARLVELEAQAAAACGAGDAEAADGLAASPAHAPGSVIRRRWPLALGLAAAAAALAAVSAAGLRGDRGGLASSTLAGAVSVACPEGQCPPNNETVQPFPKRNYQAAMDYLPVTTFFDLSTDRPWMPRPIIHKLPALIRKFDMTFALEENLGGWEPMPKGPPPSQVKTVLCQNNAPGRLLEWIRAHWDHLNVSWDRTLVFSGTESPMSETWGSDPDKRKHMAQEFRKYFKRIYYYVTDVAVEGVKTLPLGFTEMYMRDRTDQFVTAYMKTSINDSWKVHSILAAWGVYTTDGGEHYVYGHHPFQDSYGTDSPVWTEVANHAIDIRNDAKGWITTPEGKATGVQRRTIPNDQWWMELSKYKFIISPLGTAIQCSKVPEALSMLTIPIIKRGPFATHDDLVEMGFPIVVVESWADATATAIKQWWKDLSPLLVDFRTHCLNTEGYWRLLTTGKCLPEEAGVRAQAAPSSTTGGAPDAGSNASADVELVSLTHAPADDGEGSP